MTRMITQPVSETQPDTLQPRVIDALTDIRLEWECAADGQSLLYRECSVGLLLFDIMTKLQIPMDDQRFLLGVALFDEVSAFVNNQN